MSRRRVARDPKDPSGNPLDSRDTKGSLLSGDDPPRGTERLAVQLFQSATPRDFGAYSQNIRRFTGEAPPPRDHEVAPLAGDVPTPRSPHRTKFQNTAGGKAAFEVRRANDAASGTSPRYPKMLPFDGPEVTSEQIRNGMDPDPTKHSFYRIPPWRMRTLTKEGTQAGNELYRLDKNDPYFKTPRQGTGQSGVRYDIITNHRKSYWYEPVHLHDQKKVKSDA
jgi:hypothetical protein